MDPKKRKKLEGKGAEPLCVDCSEWPNSQAAMNTLIDRAIAEIDSVALEAAGGIVHFHLTDTVYYEADLKGK